MATRTKAKQRKTTTAEKPFAHLRATPEELQRLRASAPPPRSLEEWLGPPREAPEEELAELEWFLQELELLRQRDTKRLE